MKPKSTISVLRKFLLFVLATHVLTQTATADVGDVTEDYLALCQAWIVAKEGLEQTFSIEATPDDLQEILRMNMSVADDSWQSLFDKDGPADDWDQMKTTLKADDNKLEWADEWGKWKEQRAHTKKHTTANDWGKQHPRPADKNLLLQARELINHTASKAKELVKTRDTLNGKTAAQLAQKIKEHLKNAMCGSDATHKYDDGSKKCKDITGAAAPKAAKCAKTENGKALATDILCICSDASEDACTAGTAHQNHGAGSIPIDEISKITGGCPNHGVAIPLDVAITAALGRVASRIRNLEDTKAVVGIGKVTGTDCASSNNANCVDYKDRLIGENKGYSKIPWYNELAQAADAVHRFQKLQRHAATTDANLKQLRNQAESAYTRKVVPISAITNNNEANNDKTIEEKQQECEKHKDNNTACEHTGKCKWKGKTETDGPCTVDESKAGAETIAPGTADRAAGGAEAGATGCTRHGTNKAKCENDKTGDKQNCAFRKGKYK
uniref:Variant surface glycoprotein 1125.1049 n=1 Tax=Trypanosoma brucei TaxID=5691 RepID=A0A1J0R6D7_9TRYP|nr:variant surface glycoprotein 1125.1049 [Trypanosoma brucei]